MFGQWCLLGAPGVVPGAVVLGVVVVAVVVLGDVVEPPPAAHAAPTPTLAASVRTATG
jgi:hypothetical protein